MRSFNLFLIALSGLTLIASSTYAKLRPLAPIQSKPMNSHVVRGIHADVTFTLQNKLTIPAGTELYSIQNGSFTDEIEFFSQTRCHMHIRKSGSSQELNPGQVLKVSKIDNFYHHGSLHLTFWFDHDKTVSNLDCIGNFNHTLTVAELKQTWGNLFEVVLPKTVETRALFDTAPQKNPPVLSEDSDNSRPHAARILLTDS